MSEKTKRILNIVFFIGLVCYAIYRFGFGYPAPF